METVVFDESPLAEYLKAIPIPRIFAVLTTSPSLFTIDEDDDQGTHAWAQPAEPEYNVDTPPPSPPMASFAPGGLPVVRRRFRKKPEALSIECPDSMLLSSSFRSRYSSAVASRIDRAENAKFLEKFRYTVIASQLLGGHSILGAQRSPSRPDQETDLNGDHEALGGFVWTVAGAIAIAWAMKWVYSGGFSHLTKKRVLASLVVVALAASVGNAYIRQRWIRYVREQALAEVTTFTAVSQDFDSVVSAAVALIQEVELVSRGYRIVPLPPISRMDERSHTRRCVRLRKALRICFEDCMPKCMQTSDVVKAFSEQLDLEKYYDMYDISQLDITDALQGFTEDELEDLESLRAFKVVASRFHTLRKSFLCALLALEVTGDKTDFLRWTTVLEGVKSLNEATAAAYERLATILGEEESFPVVPTPKMPLSPGRERWRSQLRKLSSLSSGIRGLQAKMTLLREESDRALNEAEDVSELGPNLMSQYDSIGQDLKILVQAWEEGKTALASGIDRNEKRISSIGSLLSPDLSLSGLNTVDEGGVAEALKALNGEASPLASRSSPEADQEIFEAIALPRPRSTMSREERIAKMKADREKKAESRKSVENGRFMLRELETVLNLKNEARHGKSASTGRASL
ncbi:hypothetical protein RB596_003350 [Gaeumannomyces avenae]